MRERLIRLLWLAPTLLSAAYFAFWACAPVAYLDPPLAPNGPKGIVGFAGVYEHRTAQRAGLDDLSSFDGQIFFQRRFEHVGFGLVGAFGQSAGVSTGGYFRSHLVDGARFRLAADLQAGIAYVGVAVPVSVSLGSAVELYAAPWASYRDREALRLPVGLRIGPSGGPIGVIEAGAAISPSPFYREYYSVWGSVGVGFPFSFE